MIFTSNALSVRFFAETEFWFSFIKVAAIVLFILIGGCAVFGVLPIQGVLPATELFCFFK